MNDHGDAVEPVRVLTKVEAALVRRVGSPFGLWRVVFWQVLAMALVGLAAFVISRKTSTMFAALWGSLCVVLPSALFTQGVMRRAVSSVHAASAVVELLAWELAKIGSAVGLLFLASRWVEGLNWLALLVGLVIATQVYWGVLLLQSKSQRPKTAAPRNP